MSYRKHLMTRDELPSELYKATEVGTNLAEVGTDRISRQQAIDIAKELTITIEGYEMHNQAVMDYCAEIMRLPPAEPKRGKWFYQNGMIKCDQCLRAIRRIDHDGLLNFCPNCGADMRQKGENNESN